MALLINTTTDTATLKDFLEYYSIWCDYSTLYGNTKQPVVKNSPDGISCFRYTDVANINNCPAPVVAIDCLPEGLGTVYEYLNEYRRDKHYILFASGTWPLDSNMVEINYTLITHSYYVYYVITSYTTPTYYEYYADIDYKFEYPKALNFTCIIGGHRRIRTKFIGTLLPKLEYTNYILRYKGHDLGAPSDQFDYNAVTTATINNFNPYQSLSEKVLFTISHTLPINMYNQAYFFLLTETDMRIDHGFFITEKTLKVLLTGMPFVLVGTPHFLKNLHDMGFHTYSALWDESYDDIIDVTSRHEKISELCNDLGKFDWVANKNELELIALKNKANFLTLNKYLVREYEALEDTIANLNFG